jgi:hypothetical protein
MMSLFSGCKEKTVYLGVHPEMRCFVLKIEPFPDGHKQRVKAVQEIY